MSTSTEKDEKDDEGVHLNAGKVLAVTNKQSVEDVSKVNAFALGITRIDDLQCFSNLTVLSLSSNSVNDISGLQFCYSLVEVYLRKNNVSDLRQIGYLQNLNHLNVLFLADNPCSQQDKYRAKVLRCLKFLSTLDVTVVLDTDKSDALNTTDSDILSFEESVNVFLAKNTSNNIKPESKVDSTLFKGLQSAKLEIEAPKPAPGKQALSAVMESSQAGPKKGNILEAIKLLMRELGIEDLAVLRNMCDERLMSAATTPVALNVSRTANAERKS
jgi:hypothetical protein